MTDQHTRVEAFHMILAPLLGALLCIPVMTRAVAARAPSVVGQFVGEAMTAKSERAGRIEIYIGRWSSDDELNRLREPLQVGDATRMLSILQQFRKPVGVVFLPGIQAHGARALSRTPKTLWLARELVTPTGRQVIAVAGEHLGFGEPPLETRESVAEFSLIDIRFGADGVGVGKVVPAADVRLNPTTRMLETKNYEAHPVRLTGVKSAMPSSPGQP
jgi:hypothetical protein